MPDHGTDRWDADRLEAVASTPRDYPVAAFTDDERHDLKLLVFTTFRAALAFVQQPDISDEQRQHACRDLERYASLLLKL